NSRVIFSSNASTFGYSATMIQSFASRVTKISSGYNSSVKNGIKGCASANTLWKKAFTVSNVSVSIGCGYAGLTNTKYQAQKSSQINLYVDINASDKR